MYAFTVLAILCAAIPGARGAVRAMKEPPEERSLGAVVGLSLITVVSTVFLLALNHMDNLF